LSTTETQLHFHPEIRNGGGTELQKPPPRISRWRPAQLEIISAQLSTIEAQLIPGGLALKIAMEASVPQPPTPYLGLEVSTIENSCSAIEHNSSTIE